MRVEQNKLSSRGRKWFKRWIADPLNRQAFLSIANKWFASDPRALRAFFRREGSSIRPRSSIASHRRLKHLSLVVAVAAVLMALVSMQASFESSREPRTIVTRANEHQTRTLDDGSFVKVEPDSMLAVDFRPAQRLVHLTRGEATFDVARDPQRPFVVSTETLQVTAIGTRFSVRRGERHSSVSVAEGVVTVSARGSTHGFTYTLRAGEAFDLSDERLQGARASLPGVEHALRSDSVENVAEALAAKRRAIIRNLHNELTIASESNRDVEFAPRDLGDQPRRTSALPASPSRQWMTIEGVLAWAQSFGIGGAFFVLALSAFGICALALLVVLAVLKRGKG